MTLTAVDARPGAPAKRPGWRRRLGYLPFVLVAVVAVGTLRDRLPDPGEFLGALRAADWRWAVAALVAGVLSQFAYAEQQRRLLGALGVRVPPRRAVAMTYVRSALSMALPAGSAASAAYAFQVYRRHGATSAISATATLISTVVTVLSLTLLYAATWSPVATGAAALLALLYWIYRRVRGPAGSAPAPLTESDHPPHPGRLAGVRRVLVAPATRLLRRPSVAQALLDARSVPPRTWLAVVLAGVVNWLLDMSCLVLAAAAVHAGIGWSRLALIYLAVQVVRQIPLTPGGIGLIETSMLAGLIADGAPQATAAAIVLIYRLISFWLILPAGLAAHLTLRRPLRGDRTAGGRRRDRG
ncbi:YbhN family protein [Actinoplanes sp. L3-i22]|uniref:lysylphosphatidylglycerol synthase transmembrane domain-containing protein n=1 Tax=Actinoplanes sp. L3-i22 TaxID=2836373 RepID=UPI001C79A649|nr:YbhN family protein [Actinoplanes sp. L3-i22]BCY06983.1 membrane protein [Actinoplanes sp. L3-i22]